MALGEYRSHKAVLGCGTGHKLGAPLRVAFAGGVPFNLIHISYTTVVCAVFSARRRDRELTLVRDYPTHLIELLHSKKKDTAKQKNVPAEKVITERKKDDQRE